MDSAAAACIVQQFLDPAHGDRCQFPDDNTRPSFVCVTTIDVAVSSNASGEVGVSIHPVLSGGITIQDHGGGNSSVDLGTIATGCESYRLLGYRVDVTSKATSAQKPGVVEWWCGGGIGPLALTTSDILRTAIHGLPSADVNSNPSFGWRPSGAKSFGYLKMVDTFITTQKDDCGGLIYEVKPSLFLQFRNMEPSITGLVRLHFSIAYECIPEQDATGALLPRQPSLSNRRALDCALNAVSQLKFDFAHKRASDIRSYAVRVRAALLDPYIFTAVLRGDRVLSSIGC